MTTISFGGRCTSVSIKTDGNNNAVYINPALLLQDDNCKHIYISPLIIILFLVFLLIFIIMIYYCYRRRQKNRTKATIVEQQLQEKGNDYC